MNLYTIKSYLQYTTKLVVYELYTNFRKFIAVWECGDKIILPPPPPPAVSQVRCAHFNLRLEVIKEVLT